MKKRPLARFGLSRTLFAVLVVFLCADAFGCRRRELPRRERYRSTKKAKPEKQFPTSRLDRARDLMNKGKELYAKAIDAESQQEKNALSRQALDYYFFPAQRALEMLIEQYPEHASPIDRLGEELNRSIVAANKMIGTSD